MKKLTGNQIDMNEYVNLSKMMILFTQPSTFRCLQLHVFTHFKIFFFYLQVEWCLQFHSQFQLKVESTLQFRNDIVVITTIDG